MLIEQHRRRFLGFAIASALFLVPSVGWSGSYLNRAALLLQGANSDTASLSSRLNDIELAKVVHRMAESRVSTASGMEIPKEVALAHPHLLLVLENFERAAQAAVDKDPKGFVAFYARARDEEVTFHGVLKQLGFTLPQVKR